MEQVNSSRVADHLGVTRSAVSNWIKRGTLPEHLRPSIEPNMVPLWPESQLDELSKWYATRRRKTPVKRRPSAKSYAEGVKVGRRQILAELSKLLPEYAEWMRERQ